MIRLLGSTKKKELRNQIIILLKQLFSNLNTKCDNSKEEDSNVFKFNQPEIRSCFAAHRKIFKADDFSSSNSQVREQVSDNESSVLSPAIEQIWLEVCHESCQINRSELELILSIFHIIKSRLLSSKNRNANPKITSNKGLVHLKIAFVHIIVYPRSLTQDRGLRSWAKILNTRS